MAVAIAIPNLTSVITPIDRRCDDSRHRALAGSAPIIEAEIVEDPGTRGQRLREPGVAVIVNGRPRLTTHSPSQPLMIYGPDAQPRLTLQIPTGLLVNAVV